MRDNSKIWLGFRKSIRLYEEMLKSVCLKYHLTIIEADIISFLQHNPGKDTAMDIVELRMLSKGAVSKAVESLIQKGILQRHPDGLDRRKIHLELLREADPILKSIEETQQSFRKMIFKGFTESELELYQKLNARIYKNTLSAAEGRRLA